MLNYSRPTSKRHVSRATHSKRITPRLTLEDETQANKNINNNNNNCHHDKPSSRPSKLHCRRQKRDGYNRYHSGTRSACLAFALFSHSHVAVVDHSDVRQEAVKQALEQFGARPIPSSKRATQSQPKSKLHACVRPFEPSVPFTDLASDEGEDDDDDDDRSTSTYVTTTDDQQNKESSISPLPMPKQSHHYENPPSVESIIRSRKTNAARALFHHVRRYPSAVHATAIGQFSLRFHPS